MQTYSKYPDACAVFFPYLKEAPPIGEAFARDYLKTSAEIVRREITSLSTSKPKGSEGSWSLTITSAKNYKALIHPGCWVLIYISDHSIDQLAPEADEQSGLKMVGIVRSVRVNETIGGSGSKTIQYEISGNDFHSLLNTQVYVNRIITSTGSADTQPVVDSTALYHEMLNTPMRPDQVTRKILGAVLGKKEFFGGTAIRQGGCVAIPAEVRSRLHGATSGSSKLIDSMGLFLQKNMIGHLCRVPEYGSMFSCWSLVQGYAHRILNEVYTELLPVALPSGKIRLTPSVVHRAIPFSSPRRASGAEGDIYADRNPHLDPTGTLCMLEFARARETRDITESTGLQLYLSREIREDEIIHMNYGKSDAERFNFFFILPSTAGDVNMDGNQMYNVAQGANVSTLGDQNSIARYGMRPFAPSTDYAITNQAELTHINQVARDLWSRAYLFENGQVIIRGINDHVPVGTIIRFSDRNWIAHVERVDHQFQIAPNGTRTFRTTLSFIRLQTADSGQPIDLVSPGSNLDPSFATENRGVDHSMGTPPGGTIE